MAKRITCKLNGSVGRVRLNRPENRNALTCKMLDELSDAVSSLRSKDALRVIVLQAAGPVFCSGMDLAEMQDRAKSPDRTALWRKDSEAYHRALVALLDCHVPTVAAVSGPVIAGGVGLVLACDIIVAADSACYALPESRRGVVAAMVTPLLLRRTSHAQAGYLLLSGKRVSAERALAIGLCDEVTPPSEFDEAVRAIIDSVLQGSPHALATTKRFLESAGHDETKEALYRAIDVSAVARATDEAYEGLMSFLEKRVPVWAPKEETS